MRSAVSSLLVPLLCLALLGSLPSLQPTDGRPEMLGADRLELGDAVRLARGLTAVEGEAFLPGFRSAVLALAAVAEAGPKLVSVETKASSSSGDIVFVHFALNFFHADIEFGPLPAGSFRFSEDFLAGPPLPPPEFFPRVVYG